MRDAFQQWDHRELVPEPRNFEKLEGWIDEMRFSNEVLYSDDFTPPTSLAEPILRIWPETLCLAVDKVTDRIDAPPLAISSLGGDSLRWSLDEKPDWLEFGSTSGMTENSAEIISVDIDASKLEPGQYEGKLRFSARGSKNTPVEIAVKLTVIGEGDVREVGDRKQLFMDDRFIETSDNIELNINQAQKVRLNVDLSRNFDGYEIQPLAVFHDQQRDVFRNYYLSSGIFFLESTDGINWHQPGPELNNGIPVIIKNGKEYPVTVAPPIQGVEGAHASLLPLFVYDTHDTPERRYKLIQEYNFSGIGADGYEIDGLTSNDLTGVYGYYSDDGVRFQPVEKRLLPFLSEIPYGAYWDDDSRRYHIFVRCLNLTGAEKGLTSIQGSQFIYRNGFTYEKPEGLVDPLVPENMVATGFENIRAVTRIEATDLLEPWMINGQPVPEQNTTFALAEYLPMVAHFDKWDGFQDLYFGHITKYPFAEDVLIMGIMTLRHFHPSRQPWRETFADVNGPLGIEIAVSRNGLVWDRLDRRAYVDLGLVEEYDSVRHQTSVGIIRIGNYIYQYIKPGHRLHDMTPIRKEYTEETIDWEFVPMIALRQRLDGFVSADADYTGGSLTTPPIVFNGKRLVINQNCSGQGTIFVEIRDINNHPIPGFTLGDCEEITYNDVVWEVRWQGKANLSELAGRPIKLHFQMTNAKLYAFQFMKQANEIY